METSEPPSSTGPLLPPLGAAAIIISITGAAALSNGAVLAGILRRSRDGFLKIIAQLAVADLLLAASITPEIWAINMENWSFGSTFCTAYQGLSVLASTASMYFIAALALHIFATVNMEEKEFLRRKKRSCKEDDDEIRSSQHSLVANSDSSTPPRTMNVDYRVANTRVPVTLPIIFVWTLAASLSVPEFALAATLPAAKNTIVCTLDSNHQLNIYSLLTIFLLFLPLCIMFTASVLLLIKLNSKNLLNYDNSELVPAIKLSLCLIVMFAVLGVPRSVFRAYSVYWTTTTKGVLVSTEKNITIAVLNLSFSYIDLTLTLIRPLLYIVFLSRLRRHVSINNNNLENV